MDKKDLLVTLSDANFIDQAKQLFSSVYFNSGWEGDYMLIACGVSSENLQWFRDKGIIVRELPFLASEPLGLGKHPPIVLSKFYLFDVFFKSWRKVLFLDSDIIVRASLDGLLKLKGFNASKAVSMTLADEFISNGPDIEEIKKKCNLKKAALATGVMVFDSEIIYDNMFSDILALYNRLENNFNFSEESTLNLFFYGKHKILPSRYNSIPWYLKHKYKINEKMIAAEILHFVYYFKPWNSDSSYHIEWLDNLNRANNIDLSHRPKGKKIAWYKRLSYPLFYYFKVSIAYIDKNIGRLGLLVKKISPALYEKIRIKK